MTARFADLVENPNSPLQETQDFPEIYAENEISARDFLTLRRKAVLDGCKWDPQVGDTDTLASFPLVLKSSSWNRLASWAERLTEETIDAETEILREIGLLNMLGLPARLRRVLADPSPLTPSIGRVMRFDFHPTPQGWRISETNSDVPGGYSEGEYFTALMAAHFPNLRPAGRPGDAWANALAAGASQNGVIALLSAPGYLEDHQVVSFLARKLRERGCRPHLAKPEQIVWRDRVAHLDTTWYRGPLEAIVRFYQAEWLSRLPSHTGWRLFFREGRTPVVNSAKAIITESKRFPLTWDSLSVKLPTWRALLPETRDPRDAPWSNDDGWLLKTALCNTGDTVSIRELMPSNAWVRTRFDAFLRPKNWIAQRRFESLPIATPVGPRHVCVGIYTVNGKSAGAYARMSEKPLIDFAATDVALLVDDDD
jgi:Glutathionylspermidine synthase preATP-grasp